MRYLLLITTLCLVILSADSQVPKDKQLHAGAGATIAAWAYIIPLERDNDWKCAAWGIGVATLAGAGKELADMGGFGTPEWKDFGATVIGGIMSVCVITGIRHIARHRGARNHYQGVLFKSK